MNKPDNNVLRAAADVKHVLQKLVDAWDDSSQGAFANAEQFHFIAECLLEVSDDYRVALREEVA
jgi:hypothetical protein